MLAFTAAITHLAGGYVLMLQGLVAGCYLWLCGCCDSKWLECVDIPLGTFTLYQASSFSVANVVFDVWLNVIQLNGYRGFALSANATC